MKYCSGLDPRKDKVGALEDRVGALENRCPEETRLEPVPEKGWWPRGWSLKMQGRCLEKIGSVP